MQVVPYTEDGLRLSERLRSVARELERVPYYPSIPPTRPPTHTQLHITQECKTAQKSLFSTLFLVRAKVVMVNRVIMAVNMVTMVRIVRVVRMESHAKKGDR